MMGLAPERAVTELVGHESARARLAELIASDRLQAGWLLSGPEGIGKTSLAWLIAKKLMMPGAGLADAGPGLFGDAPGDASAADLAIDPHHPAVQRVTAGTHGDIMAIAREASDDKGRMKAEIGIEPVRKLGRFLSLTASEGGRRVVIIEEAERLTINAQNALLKELEEPPEGTLILLVTSAPARLLPTIRSRCRQLALGPVQDEAVGEALATRFPQLSPDARALILRLAEGRPGAAFSLAAGSDLETWQGFLAILDEEGRLEPTAAERFAETLAPPGADAAWRGWMRLYGLWLGWLVRPPVLASAGEGLDGRSTALAARLAARLTLEQRVGLWETSLAALREGERAALDRKQVLLQALRPLRA